MREKEITAKKWISSTESDSWSQDNWTVSEAGETLTVGEPIGKPLYGFGTCISELGVRALSAAPFDKRREVYDALFGDEGCGFSFCRLSVGANDFAEGWYSCDEEDGDYEMMHFSIARDRKNIIPTVKEAIRRSPRIQFFASPWSPPTWMKFPPVYNYGKIRSDERTLRAYALYLRKFVEEYVREGVPVTQIHFQNEMFADQKFPSCKWDPETIETFIGDYLGPALDGRAEVWFGTVNGPEDERNTRHDQYLQRVMQNEKCRKYIKGASYQWAGKLGILGAEEDFPELSTINSEMECGNGDNSWEYAMYNFTQMRHYLRHGARACVYWNFALDDTTKSTWGWSQNSLVTVRAKEIVYNPEFYLMKHFARFVKRGAVMLKTTGSFSTNAAVFANPDGSRYAVMLNPRDTDVTVTIEGKNYQLKPRSFHTIEL